MKTKEYSSITGKAFVKRRRRIGQMPTELKKELESFDKFELTRIKIEISFNKLNNQKGL